LPERGLVLLDGEACPPSEAKVSVFDRGFLYGDSVFESLRTYAGRPFALVAHLERLERSAGLAAMRLPLSLGDLGREIERGLALAGFEESFVRVMVTRGQGAALGLDPALAEQPLRVILILPLHPLPAEKYEQGIKAITYRTQRISDGIGAEGAKLGNYLLAVLASAAARRADAEEALIVDSVERVLEGATSNVFAVRAGRLLTPPLSAAILPGITRAVVLDVARRLGLACDERELGVGELASCDELFVSSSIRELVPIVRLDESVIGEGVPGPLFRRLLVAFRAHVRA
jgi:branched-chain amino acid aminotransferase